MPDEGTWKLDRHIPIAVIFAMLVQTGGAVWWAAGISSRVDTATEINLRQDADIKATANALSVQQVGIATAAAELRALRDSLTEVKQAQLETNKLLRELLTAGDKP
jgi:hypothetical protein